MEAESTSGDVRGRCNLGAPGLQCGGVMNAGRGATVRTHAVHPKLSVRGRLLGVPDLRCAFPQLVKDSWVRAPMPCSVVRQHAFWGTCDFGVTCPKVEANHGA